jgi:hypothetical protein
MHIPLFPLIISQFAPVFVHGDFSQVTSCKISRKISQRVCSSAPEKSLGAVNPSMWKNTDLEDFE